MKRTELLERLATMSCSAVRKIEVEYMVNRGDIISPDLLRFAATCSEKALSAFAEARGVDLSTIRDGVSGEIVSTSRKHNEDEDENTEDEEELKRMAHLTGQSVSAIKKALAAKRAECSDEVDEDSLVRNGLGKAHAPAPLGTSSMEECRLSQDCEGTPGQREAGVVATLRALESWKA